MIKEEELISFITSMWTALDAKHVNKTAYLLVFAAPPLVRLVTLVHVPKTSTATQLNGAHGVSCRLKRRSDLLSTLISSIPSAKMVCDWGLSKLGIRKEVNVLTLYFFSVILFKLWLYRRCRIAGFETLMLIIWFAIIIQPLCHQGIDGFLKAVHALKHSVKSSHHWFKNLGHHWFCLSF